MSRQKDGWRSRSRRILSTESYAHSLWSKRPSFSWTDALGKQEMPLNTPLQSFHQDFVVGLGEKCPPYTQVFEHLVLRWCLFGGYCGTFWKSGALLKVQVTGSGLREVTASFCLLLFLCLNKDVIATSFSCWMSYLPVLWRTLSY